MAAIGCPSLRSVQKGRDNYGSVDQQLGVNSEVFVLEDSVSQTSEGFSSSADPILNFVIDDGIKRQVTSKIRETVTFSRVTPFSLIEGVAGSASRGGG